MHRCEGGELFDQICDMDEGHYTEADTCLIMHQIADGVNNVYILFCEIFF